MDRASYERCSHEFRRPYRGGATTVQLLEETIALYTKQYAAEPPCFLFPSFAIVQSSGLETQLYELYDFAVHRWDSVGHEWFALFDNQADFAVCERVTKHTSTEPSGCRALEEPRILVLAIDEARFLLKRTPHDGLNWYERLHCALACASSQIRSTFGHQAGIVAVLVDANPAIIDRVDPNLPRIRDQSREDDQHYGDNRLPPFVLTHTIDTRFKTLVAQAPHEGLSSNQFYQRLVNLPYKKAWPTLVSMGRPLWDRVKIDDWDEKEDPREVIELAAFKLLGGFSGFSEASYCEESLFGVASVFCRLGLHAHSCAHSVASTTVARYMATLVDVPETSGQLQTAYPSEPVLTFGAARVWYGAAYQGAHAILAKTILPHFWEMLSWDTVAMAGEPSDFLSRMVMLLTMDAVVPVVSGKPHNYTYQYAGEFYSVETFLNVLYGDHAIVVRNGQRDDVTSAFGQQACSMLRKWQGWKVGFSHFMSALEEPSEAELWAMLARRAAGVFPREFGHVDLFIPIFNTTTVSLILIKATTYAGSDPMLSAALMRPSSVFTNELRLHRPEDVVRVHLDWTDLTQRQQHYLVDSGEFAHHESESTTESFVVCIEGVHAWNTRMEEQPTGWMPCSRRVPVVSKDLATALRKLLEPRWDPARAVEQSLARLRVQMFSVMDLDDIRSIVTRPLAASLLTALEPSDEEA